MATRKTRPASTAGVEVLAESPVPLSLSESSNENLESLALKLADCMTCKLCQGRKTVVVGEGAPQAKLMFVGDVPGETEDELGRPFIGDAGQLLNKMIIAMGLTREQVYLTNVVKCRPPEDREPASDEVASCSNYLYRQIDLIQPRVVVALGGFAAQTLLGTSVPLSQLRGKLVEFRSGAKLMPTWHPSDLLRHPESKKEAWEDLKTVQRELGMR